MSQPDYPLGVTTAEILGDLGREASRERGLQYDWLGPLMRLVHEPNPRVGPARCMAVAAFANAFIADWADWAELAKMQPAHLFRNVDGDEAGRGLAWRWTDAMDVVCFPRERHLVVESIAQDDSQNLFVYRFEPDGRTVHVFGAQRQAILGAFIQLSHEPSVRARYIASGGLG